jgi:hypothetical protein
MANTIDTLIKQWAGHSRKVSPAQLARVVAGIGVAPFTTDLLEVDEALWGGFWHFDVISAGYRLPALELALLRATRLDHTWPDNTSPAQFLADLHEAIQHPQAGIWTLRWAEEPWAVFAAQLEQPWITVAWYCATTGRLHAGYRALMENLHLDKLPARRPPQFTAFSPVQPPDLDWLKATVEQDDLTVPTDLAARLDVEILRWRLKPSLTP